MSVQDYKINAEVRRFLVSRWVDVSRLNLGCTNGVVYIIGYLDTLAVDPARHAAEVERMSDIERTIRMARCIDRDVRRLPAVRDVVFKLENVYKRGGTWRVVADVGDATGSVSSKGEAAP